VDLR
jgi:hypothetical protein